MSSQSPAPPMDQHGNPLLPPLSDATSAPFWQGCRDGVLRMQRCPDTHRLIFPPRPMSPWGERRPPEWVDVSGRGTIWSFVVPHPPLLPQFAAVSPYNVVVVALDEDPTVRVIGNLVARPGGRIDEIDPATIRIGEPVRVVFDTVTDDVVLPRWVRA